jgi:hypothetical protein
MTTVVVVSGVSAVLGLVAIASYPEVRVPALVAWLGLGALVQRASGERVTARSILFSAAFTLPPVSTAVAAYGVHERWGVSGDTCFAAVVATLVLFGAIFFRALIASGSADGPEDTGPQVFTRA